MFNDVVMAINEVSCVIFTFSYLFIIYYLFI